MRTRQKPRTLAALPGRLRAGNEDEIDVVLQDLSQTGCRFAFGAARLAVGHPVRLSIAGIESVNGAVVWIEQGEAGIVFRTPLGVDQVERLDSGYIGGSESMDARSAAPPMAASDAAQPLRRYC